MQNAKQRKINAEISQKRIKINQYTQLRNERKANGSVKAEFYNDGLLQYSNKLYADLLY